MNIWYIFGKPGIPEFGDRYTSELNQWKELSEKQGNDEKTERQRQKGEMLRSHMIRLVIKFVQE
jgi:hypothetical protein